MRNYREFLISNTSNTFNNRQQCSKKRSRTESMIATAAALRFVRQARREHNPFLPKCLRWGSITAMFGEPEDQLSLTRSDEYVAALKSKFLSI